MNWSYRVPMCLSNYDFQHHMPNMSNALKGFFLLENGGCGGPLSPMPVKNGSDNDNALLKLIAIQII